MPDIQAQTPDGVIHTFPDGTAPDVVDRVVREHISGTQRGIAPDPIAQSRASLASKVQPDATVDNVTKAFGDSVNPFGLINKGSSKLGSKLGQSIDSQDAAALKAGDPSKNAGSLKRMAKTASDMVAGATEPANVAKAGLVTAANTNPFTGIPVDAYLAGQGAAGVAKNAGAIKDLVTTGQANPDQLEEGLSSASQAVGSLAGLKGEGAAARSLAADDPASAAQRGLRPPMRRQQAFQKDLSGASPYLKGADDLTDLQSKLPGAKNEIWTPYSDALSKIAKQPVVGPDGPTTYAGLEQLRTETSAQLQQVRKLAPTDQQTLLQKNQSMAELQRRYNSITGALDPALRQQGIEPQDIRSTFGNVKGVERLASGRNTLAEQPKRYGLGKMAESLDLWHPLNSLSGVAEGARDLVAGKPLWSGKPTDVNIQQGFRVGGDKPNFNITPPPPLQAPPTATPPIPFPSQPVNPGNPFGHASGGPTPAPSPLLPPVPQSNIGAPAPSGLMPPPSLNGGPGVPRLLSPSGPRFPEPTQPMSPQELLDLSHQAGRPLNPIEAHQFRVDQDKLRNVHTALGGNRQDLAGNIREAHRATLEQPKIR